MTELELRQALTRSLSSELPVQTRRAVLRKIGEKERFVVKNKLRFSLIIAIVLTLLSTVALAVTLSREYFEEVARLQFESGWYEDWGIEEKLLMVDILEEYGLVSKEEADRMTDEETIDAFMIARYGVEGSDRMDTIGLYSILEKELGLVGTWSLEQRAWYSDMLMRVGLLKRGGEEGIFGVPEEEDVQPEEAVAIAKAAIIEAFGLAENALDNYELFLSFETDSNDWERENLYYIIAFRGEGYDDFYWCNITRDGLIMDSTMDEHSRSPAEQAEQKHIANQEATAPEAARPEGHYEQWSLADKARWLGADNGIPGEGDLSEAEAVAIAQRRLHDIGYDLSDYEISVWYKLYGYYTAEELPSEPFYVVYFVNDLEAPTSVFSIVIDAGSGNILQEYAPAPSHR